MLEIEATPSWASQLERRAMGAFTGVIAGSMSLSAPAKQPPPGSFFFASEQRAPDEEIKQECVSEPQTYAQKLASIPIPEEVIRQLKMALGSGIALERMNVGELRAAANSFVGDGRVIDDPAGTDLSDMFELDADEIRQQQATATGCLYLSTPYAQLPGPSFFSFEQRLKYQAAHAKSNVLDVD